MIYPAQRVTAPFRAEVVGSYLRPQSLIDAQSLYRRGEISLSELEKVEDAEIERLVMKQYNAGLESSTDGEYRRRYWDLDFYRGLSGVNLIGWDDDSVRPSVALNGRVEFRSTHPFLRHFTYLKSITPLGMIPRISLPSPAQFYSELTCHATVLNFDIYDSIDSLKDDIVKAYNDMLMALYDCGCRNVMFDDRTWRACPTPDEDLSSVLLELNNGAVQGVPYDYAVSLHMCCGGGGGDSLPIDVLRCGNVKSYYLEFDIKDSSSLGVLKFVPADKTVVLGLVSPEDPSLERKEELITRIKEAAQYIPLDRLCLGTGCGFAYKNHPLSESEQWAKIRLIQEVADAVW